MHYGIEFGPVISVEPKGNILGRVDIIEPSPGSISDGELYKRMIAVYHAGPVAEWMASGGKFGWLGGGQDYEDCGRWSVRLFGARVPRNLSRLSASGPARASRILLLRWRHVEKVANLLVQRRTLNPRELEAELRDELSPSQRRRIDVRSGRIFGRRALAACLARLKRERTAVAS